MENVTLQLPIMSVVRGKSLYRRSNSVVANVVEDNVPVDTVPVDVVLPSSIEVTPVIDVDTLCKWCSVGNLIPCNAELICNNCGVINALYHTSDSDLTYIDGSMQLKGHKTVVNKWTPKSSVSNYKMKQIGRRRIYVNEDIPYKERQLTSTFKMIDSKCGGRLDARTVTNIKDMYHKITDNYIIKLNKIGFIAGIVSVCCRINGCPRSDQEISTMFGITTVNLTKGMNRVMDRMVELRMNDTIETMTTAIAVPQTFVNRFCAGLGLNDTSFIETVNSTITNLTELNVIDSIDEASVAGAVILYVASVRPYKDTIKVHKKDVQLQCGTSIATINRCYKLIVANNVSVA